MGPERHRSENSGIELVLNNWLLLTQKEVLGGNRWEASEVRRKGSHTLFQGLAPGSAW